MTTAGFYGMGESWDSYLGKCVGDAANLGIGLADKICSFLTFGIGGNKQADTSMASENRLTASEATSTPPLQTAEEKPQISADILAFARAVTPNLANLQVGEYDMNDVTLQATPLNGIIAARAAQTAQPSMAFA